MWKEVVVVSFKVAWCLLGGTEEGPGTIGQGTWSSEQGMNIWHREYYSGSLATGLGRFECGYVCV
jgi:hypothetical protein